jgi:hypothetical protein
MTDLLLALWTLACLAALVLAPLAALDAVRRGGRRG